MVVEKWAVLIGINEYLPGNKRVNEESDHVEFENLNGCLNDVNQIEQYLLICQGVDQDHISKLTSPAQPGDELRPDRTPTAQNILKTLKECAAKVNRGDIVYIHYSGHGARVESLSQRARGEGSNGIEECLVPYDVADGGSFLRSVEWISHLSKITSKGVFLTVTVDCCHSGGTARQESGIRVRGIAGVIKNLETDQPLIDIDPSDPTSEQIGQGGNDNYKSAAIDLDPKDYALLAACGSHQKAYETRRHGKWMGIFTHWLLQSLKTAGNDATHRIISDRTFAKVREDRSEQTPIGTGKTDRYFMGSGSEQPSGMGSFVLSKVRHPARTGELAALSGGKAHWVNAGDEFAIFPWNETRSDTTTRLAVVRVTTVADLESSVVFEEVTDPRSKIETGCRALRIKKLALIQVIVMDGSEGHFNQFGLALKNFKDNAIPLELTRQNAGKLADCDACYQVESISREPGKYRLLSESGGKIPLLPDAADPTEIFEQAEHIGAFHMIRELRSDDTVIGNLVEFKVDNVTPNHMDAISFTFKNNTQHPVYVRILNFEPLWGVKQVYPSTESHQVDGRSSFSKRIQVQIPISCGSSVATVTDTLKCLVTSEPTKFEALRMLGLDRDGRFPELRGSRGLASLLRLLMPPQRDIKVLDDDKVHWASKEVTITTHR